jgi:hypothetical protein
MGLIPSCKTGIFFNASKSSSNKPDLTIIATFPSLFNFSLIKSNDLPFVKYFFASVIIFSSAKPRETSRSPGISTL